MSYPDSLSQITSEYEAAFGLIDVVFSLESCLHHQILPLELLDNHLVVGMVDPKNIETIKFIHPILQSLGYGFHVQALDVQAHQLIIATYLQRPPNSSPSSGADPNNHSVGNSSPAHSAKDHSNSLPMQVSDNYSPTIFEDYSDDEEVEDQELLESPSHNLHDRPTLIVNGINSSADEIKPPPSAMSFEYENSRIFSSQPQIDNTLFNQVATDNSFVQHSEEKKISPPVIEEPVQPDNPIQGLIDLPPKLLWQELLSGAISGGIGRLFFRQLATHGHIMCSRDGVIQSSLEDVPLDVFSEVVKEIKKMAKLPLTKLKKNKKVALQKFHDQERVLLRGEFFIGEFGDEITLQVLRGQALHFYEQRQVDKTLKKAIYLGRQLEKTLRKIKMCSTSAELGDLHVLKETLKQVDKRLRLLDS